MRRTAATRTTRLLAAAMACALACCVVLTASVASASGTNRAGVVVDLGNGDVRNAGITFSGSVSGVAALQLAGFSPHVRSFGGLGGAVCSLDIGGTTIGCPTDTSCLTCDRQSRYWEYFRAPASSTRFAFSCAGAGTTVVNDGDVEGWRFAAGNTAPPYSPIATFFPPPTTTTAPPATTATRPPTTSTLPRSTTTKPSGVTSQTSPPATQPPPPGAATTSATSTQGSDQATSTTKAGDPTGSAIAFNSPANALTGATGSPAAGRDTPSSTVTGEPTPATPTTPTSATRRSAREHLNASGLPIVQRSNDDGGPPVALVLFLAIIGALIGALMWLRHSKAAAITRS